MMSEEQLAAEVWYAVRWLAAYMPHAVGLGLVWLAGRQIKGEAAKLHRAITECKPVIKIEVSDAVPVYIVPPPRVVEDDEPPVRGLREVGR
jgi:hypothetical protein